MIAWSTLFFVHFGKSNFSDFWCPQNLLGPSKKTQLLDSWPLRMPNKLGLEPTVLKILSCIYCSAKDCSVGHLLSFYWNSRNFFTFSLVILIHGWTTTEHIYVLGYSRVLNKRTSLNKHSRWNIWQNNKHSPLNKRSPLLK